MWEATIGLEIHAELKTKSKMFCFCNNNPDDSEPNTEICPICMAHPGTLPVPNKAAIESIVKIGLAVGGDVANYSEFDRKSYFYPDIPKAYQISQYKYPIVSGGSINGIALTRIHLEEDTARSIHDQDPNYTYIDFNRAGVPLMELVTEPVIRNAEEARDFAKELQLLLRYLDVSDANLEKGQMRIEANVSIKNPDGSFGTKVEVKNLNSFSAVYNAIKYEINRQIELLEAGENVVQETRGWDENKQCTFSQRVKEEAADYRYFPDPDLSKLELHSLFNIEELKEKLPELPWEKRERYKALGLSDQDTEFLVQNQASSSFFDSILKQNPDLPYKKLANYVINDLAGLIKDAENIPALLNKIENQFSILMSYSLNDKISSRTTKDIISLLIENNELDVEAYIKDNNLEQNNDPEMMKGILQEILPEFEQAVQDYKAGNEKALGAIIGPAMKKLRENGITPNPKVLMELLKELI